MPALKSGLFLATICFAYGLVLPLPLSLPSHLPSHLAATAPVLECDGCKWMVGKMQTYLKNNEPHLDNVTIGVIEQNICAHLPDNATTAYCDQLVERYVPFAFDSLVEKVLDPTFICTEVVPLCSDTAIFQNATNRVKNSKTVEVCDAAFGMVSSHVSQKLLLEHAIYAECKREHPAHVLKCEVVSMHVSNAVLRALLECETRIF